MTYQLELLYRLILGDLSPDNNATIGFNEHITFLQQHFTFCIKHYKVHFKQASSGEYVYQNFAAYTFLDLSGLLYLEDSLTDNDPQQLENLIIDFLNQISIVKNDITKAQFKKTKKELQLEITAQIDFAQLTPEEAKYHYYYAMAYYEVERIKKALTYQSFRLQNRNQIALYIQNHQLSLEKLARSLIGQLEVHEQEQLYSISKEFTLADIYKIIYIQLEKVQQHLEGILLNTWI